MTSTNLNTMQKHRSITVERLEKFIQTGQFSDVNLRSSLWKKKTESNIALSVYSVPNLQRISFAEAMKGQYKPTKLGESFGPGWATHWFKVSITIPSEFKGEEVVLNFDPDCEGMVWLKDGTPVQGITATNHIDYRLTKKAEGGEAFDFFIEIACNGMFGNGDGGFIEPPDPKRTFKLKVAELAVPNLEAWALLWDFEILLGLVKDAIPDSQISSDALYTANLITNTFRRGDQSSISEARNISMTFLKDRIKVGQADHKITAIGNCHIDTAWLWPYDETKRKAGRSWATQLSFMEDYPFYKFAASQAQQFEWVEEHYPQLFKKMQEKSKAGQFIPIGGTWVEMDCNIPSGESFCRQFLYGQRYFESKFGSRCSVFWLPDTFGYSAQLPQIVKESGLKYFFTQKLSWNNINKFPHTTFLWKGLDGSSVLTHFSPADTYVAQGTVRDVAFSVKNNKDKEYTNKSLLLFGNGDGGGGPLVEMIERLDRLQKVEGLPATVSFGSPNDFFEDLEKSSKDLVSWKGELYFELHRGTYTTHGLMKRYNRKLEYLLREVELYSTLATLLKSGKAFSNPKAELDRLWKLVLLNQFHDVLPGSSIEMVYDDARKYYEDVDFSANKLRADALKIITKWFSSAEGNAQALMVLNSTSWPRTAEVIEFELSELLPGAELYGGSTWQQLSSDGQTALILVDEVPAMAFKPFALGNKPATLSPVFVSNVDKNAAVMENKYVRVKIHGGRLASCWDKIEGREVIAHGEEGNVFKLFEDVPLFWDAWDVEVYHLEKGWNSPAGTITIEEAGPIRAVLLAKTQITATSHIEQRIILTAASSRIEFDTIVKWNENRIMLKVEFPLAINCDYATFETQFGYIQRPTHYNNSWDLARFEVCGHKYADLSEFEYGVALLNDCKYGYSVKDNIMRLSLLRSPKAPDANCDIGTHRIRYALYPHKGTFHESDVIRQAYQFNVPPAALRLMVDSKNPSNLTMFDTFNVSAKNIVLDTVKIAEDPRPESMGVDTIIRLYEASGGRGTFKFSSAFPIKEATYCNVLEDISGPVERDADGNLTIPFSPFKIITLRLLLTV